MRLGHVIYAAKDLDATVKEWRDKGFTVLGYRVYCNIIRKLKWESYCIFVQLLKCFDKCGKALATVGLVSAEHAVKAFPAVIWDPCKLSAVVV